MVTITSPVMVQITSVSMNGPSEATSPSRTGSSVLAVAWAIGALPCPASLLNRPRRMPHISVIRNDAGAAADQRLGREGLLDDQREGRRGSPGS